MNKLKTKTQLPQTAVSDSSLDKLISKLPIVYDWVNYKGEDVVASINIERTLKAKKAMMNISYCMTKAFNNIHLKTVMFNKKHFKTISGFQSI